MVAGRVYELKIDLKFVAYVVPAAHALRFSVASADLQNAWPCASRAVHTLHRGAATPSRVVLPLAPADARTIFWANPPAPPTTSGAILYIAEPMMMPTMIDVQSTSERACGGWIG